jgi:2-(1,2-epoxy-1,2-dihydrophenyl)acetyl-CoA isomerase
MTTSGDAATEQPVLLRRDGGVATVTLNRPDAMNSLDVATKDALLAAVTEVAEDETVRCVVLTGTGRAFCVGQDLKEHVDLLQNGGSDALFTTVPRHYNPTVLALATMPKPVVAALNGVAAGAGASLALACDYRIAADSAGVNLAFSGIALSCDTGSSWTLPRLVGPAKALELLYEPRTIPAGECLELGLVTRVVAADELEAATRAVAERLAAGPTLSYAAIRRSVHFSATHDLPDSLAFEAQMMAETGATADHRDAVDAFVAKQRPTFHAR